MTAFIRHEYGLVDAAEVIEINNGAGYGGHVAIRTAVTRADGDGYVVARLLDSEAAVKRMQETSGNTLDADLKASAKVAENLAYAISEAVADDQAGRLYASVIDYNREGHGWTITPLRRIASPPVNVN